MARTTTTAAKTTRTRAAKPSVQKGAEQHANHESLKQVEGETSTPDSLLDRAAAIQQQVEADRKAGMVQQPAGATEFKQGEGFVAAKLNDANLQSPRISHSVLVSSIVKASINRKAAITLEVAVVLSVFAAEKSSSKQAKKELYAVYKEAGYDCNVGGDGHDYKTINRRISYIADFFDSLKVEELNAIMGDTKGEEALTMLVNWLSNKYIFRSMNDVLLAAGKTPPSQTRTEAAKGSGTEGDDKGQGGNQQPPQGGQGPSGGGAAGEGQGQSVFQTSAAANPTGVPQSGPSEADKGVMAAMQQAGAERKQEQTVNDDGKFMKFSFEGATLLIPADYKVECLTELSLKLQLAAHHMKGRDTVDKEVLEHEFSAAAVAH